MEFVNIDGTISFFPSGREVFLANYPYLVCIKYALDQCENIEQFKKEIQVFGWKQDPTWMKNNKTRLFNRDCKGWFVYIDKIESYTEISLFSTSHNKHKPAPIWFIYRILPNGDKQIMREYFYDLETIKEGIQRPECMVHIRLNGYNHYLYYNPGGICLSVHKRTEKGRKFALCGSVNGEEKEIIFQAYSITDIGGVDHIFNGLNKLNRIMNENRFEDLRSNSNKIVQLKCDLREKFLGMKHTVIKAH